MKNNVKYFGSGEFEYGTGEFNLEDVLQALRHHKLGGIDKSKLRELLTILVEKGHLEKIEDSMRVARQSKGTYKITPEGIDWLTRYQSLSGGV